MQGKVPMSVANFVKIATQLPPTESVLIRGNHGIGKSQITQQIGNIRNLAVVDRRLSQMSEGDMLGLPVIKDNSTTFNPPDWYKECCDGPRLLLLDEFNRASQEVMQAGFEIVLDRRMNGRPLHKDTVVYACINSSAAYNVNEMDPALLDRFFVVDLAPSSEEWVAWARNINEDTKKPNIISPIIGFIQSNNRWLDTPESYEPGHVVPSRRSWAKVSSTLSALQLDKSSDHESDIYHSTVAGFVGIEAALAFRTYVKNNTVLTGQQIINGFTSKKIKNIYFGLDGKLEQTQEYQNGAIDSVHDHIKKMTTMTAKQIKNLNAFALTLPGELGLSLWSKLMNDNNVINPTQNDDDNDSEVKSDKTKTTTTMVKAIHAALGSVVIAAHGIVIEKDKK